MERTKPGATLLTVMPNAKLERELFGQVYQSVRFARTIRMNARQLGRNPAPDEIVTIRPASDRLSIRLAA